MAKVTLNDLTNLSGNPSSAQTTINANNTAIETAMEKTLSRDGTGPNQMEADIDMNSNQIFNLPDATTNQEPVTLSQLNDAIDSLEIGAISQSSYLTLGPDVLLDNERILTAGTNISITDAGAGSIATVAVSGTDLNAYEALSTTGLVTRTGDGTSTTRTITGTANEVTVTNGSGVSANPTLSLPAALTFTGKTVTGGSFSSPAITTPTGIVKGDVGLGNVDNTSDATKNSASATLTNKTINGSNNTITNVSLATGVTGNLPVTRLNSGTSASATTFWRGDGAWATPAGAGDMLKSENLSGLASNATARTNLGVPPLFHGLATGMQPYLWSPDTQVGFTRGAWSSNDGSKIITMKPDHYVDFTSVTPNLAVTPAMGAFISGTLSTAGTTTDNTEVCFYLCHRISDDKPFIVATVSGNMAHDDTLSFTDSYTATNASPCVFTTSIAHGLRKHHTVFLETGAPTGFSTLTPYYVVDTPTATTFRLASSIANARAGTMMASSSTGAGNLSYGVQRELDHRLGAGIAKADRRYPYFAFIWSVDKFGPNTGIPNFFNAVDSAYTVLTNADSGASKFRVLDNGTATTYTVLSLGITGSTSGFLHDVCRKVRLFCQVSSNGTAGTAYIRTGGLMPIGWPVGTVSASASDFRYMDLDIRTTGSNQIEYKVDGGARLSLWVKGWEFCDT